MKSPFRVNAFWLTVLNWWVRVKPPSGFGDGLRGLDGREAELVLVRLERVEGGRGQGVDPVRAGQPGKPA